MNNVVEFSIHYTQYLDENGVAVQPLPSFAKERGYLYHRYRGMLRTRLFDERAVSLQRTGELGTYAASRGQEAVAEAVGATMRPEDVLLPTYREQGVYLARGVTMTELLVYWGGDERGMDFAVAREDFPVTIPIATQLPHAVGIAYAFQYRDQPRVAVPVCGDGATSKGDFYEAINAAGVWQLPCVFVVANNEWAISQPRSQQTRCETLAQKAIAAGITGEQVDGNDVIAVADRFGAALTRAREGGGPSLIEALTYRVSDHTTADDARRYRSDEEVTARAGQDPVLRLRRYLLEQGQLSESDDETLRVAIREEIEAAVRAYLATPPRAPTTLFDCLYERLPEALQEQLADCRADHPDHD